MNNELFKMWKEAKTPADYIILIYISLLVCIFAVSFVSIIYLLITEPERFYNLSFGIFDHL